MRVHFDRNITCVPCTTVNAAMFQQLWLLTSIINIMTQRGQLVIVRLFLYVYMSVCRVVIIVDLS